MRSLVKGVFIILRSWIVGSWVLEFTILIFGVVSGNNCLGGVNKSSEIDFVGDVGVEVVLPVLDFVHTFLNDLVSSNSWEREGGVEELPGVNWWQFMLKVFGNLDSILVILNIKMSGELIHLPSELFSVDPEALIASTFLWGESINDTIIIDVSSLKLDVLIIRGRRRRIIGFRLLGMSLCESVGFLFSDGGLVNGSGFGGGNDSDEKKDYG